ncbi:MAG TPA: biosynthetic peptidoglycan transglycosylase, partial [Kofleriaceae bacterium]|nr:biosynthetic peptidoglycan transglycosylase [Kofleriaceae bacterium]
EAPWRASAELDDRGAPRRIAAALASEAGGRALGLELDRVPLDVVGPLAPPVLALDGARASGRLTVATGDGVTVTGRLTLEGARIRYHALADEPVALDGTVDVDARVAGDRLELTNLAVTRGAASLAVSGFARWDGGRIVAADATATLAPVGCRALIDALPGPLRGPLDQLAVTGAMTGAAHVAFDLTAPATGGPDGGPGTAGTAGTAGLAGPGSEDGVVLDLELDPHACVVTADPPVIDPRRLAVATPQSFPDGHQALVGPGVGDWVDPMELPGHVRGAFVAAEDARFWDHHGFDAVQIARSLAIDLREDRMARGGSTITQQLVKNSFLHQRRTLARKLQEAVLTWRVEAVLDKKTILARYLNIVELGPGVYGVGAGAQFWFGKPAARLTVREAAFLAALAPAPATMTRRLQAAHGLDPATGERVEVTLRAMKRAGVIGSIPGGTLAFRPAAIGR